MVLVVNNTIRTLPQFLGIDVSSTSSLVSVYHNYRSDEYPRFDPDYAILLDNNGKPYLSVCGTMYDSSTSLYQPVCAAKTSNDSIVAVAGVYCNSMNECYRAIIDANGNVYRAPVIVEIKTASDEIVKVPMGFICGGLCIAAVIIILGAIAAGAIGYAIHSVAEKTEAEAKKELVDVIVKTAEEKCKDARCVAALASSIAPAIIEYDVRGSINKTSWLDSLKNLVAQFVAPMAGITAIIALMIRLNVLRLIIDMFRDMLRRR